MREEIERLLTQWHNMKKLEREVWHECDKICADYQMKIGAPEGYTYSGYLDTPEAKLWRKKWNASKATVNLYRNQLECAIKSIHPDLSLGFLVS